VEPITLSYSTATHLHCSAATQLYYNSRWAPHPLPQPSLSWLPPPTPFVPTTTPMEQPETNSLPSTYRKQKEKPFQQLNYQPHTLLKKHTKKHPNINTKKCEIITKNKSRRITQRRLKRNKNKEQSQLSRKIQRLFLHTKKNCLSNYGFCSDPSSSIQKNFNTAITALTSYPNKQPSNLTFHNLCQQNELPPGTKHLLGLNLKYCLTSNKLDDGVNNTLLKLAQSIRTKHFLNTAGFGENSEYIPQIYLKNKTWDPPPASILIEDQITNFEKSLKKEIELLQKKYKNKNISNLTPLQFKALKKLKQNTNLIIKPTDKNLGPAVMDRAFYINKILNDHLLTKDYVKLSRNEALSKLQLLKETLKILIKENQEKLSQPEITYFNRCIKLQHRVPLFYGLPKIHKNPISLRPVVSTTNSLLSYFSNWADYKMKELLPLVRSYTKNSTSIIEDLKNLNIPKEAKLFAADAKSMYTNIDTDLGLATLKDFLTCNNTHLPPDFPTDFFLSIMEIVMKNNIFSFMDSYWLQLSGTAMGTPVACSYATITYGHHENTKILTVFEANLLYYRRYIDDIFGVWLPPDTNETETWNNFKKELNNWGTLEWVIEEPSKETIFLDLTLNLQNSRIYTRTYQKEMNLYLYIPAHSAHPPSCLKGLISGEMFRYWLQNNTKDFETILSKFIQRLTERGHQIENLIPLFRQAAINLSTKIATPSFPNATTQNNNNILYLHWKYNPKGIQRNTIHRLYNEILKPHLNFTKMIIAMSRPTNLKDLLVKAALPPSKATSPLIQEAPPDTTNPT
jgi:hypothetical protein